MFTFAAAFGNRGKVLKKVWVRVEQKDGLAVDLFTQSHGIFSKENKRKKLVKVLEVLKK